MKWCRQELLLRGFVEGLQTILAPAITPVTAGKRQANTIQKGGTVKIVSR